MFIQYNFKKALVQALVSTLISYNCEIFDLYFFLPPHRIQISECDVSPPSCINFAGI